MGKLDYTDNTDYWLLTIIDYTDNTWNNIMSCQKPVATVVSKTMLTLKSASILWILKLHKHMKLEN